MENANETVSVDNAANDKAKAFKALTFVKALQTGELEPDHIAYIADESKDASVLKAVAELDNAPAEALSLISDKVSPKDEATQLLVVGHKNANDESRKTIALKTKYPTVVVAILESDLKDGSWLGSLVESTKDVETLSKIGLKADDEVRLAIIGKLNAKKDGQTILTLVQAMKVPAFTMKAVELFKAKLAEKA